MSKHPSPRIWQSGELVLRRRLTALKRRCGVTSLKVSTEDAGNSFQEIQETCKLFGDIIPIQAKIGGPEARNDMRAVVDLGCRSVIAPMIESPYALKKFLQSLREELGDKAYGIVGKQINVETERACRDIRHLLAADKSYELNQITVGRTDLCRSMGLPPDHPRVMALVKRVVDAARRTKLKVSVGGRITPGDARAIVKLCAPTRLNTRDIGFDPRRCGPLGDAVREILNFEIALLEHQKQFAARAMKSLTERISKLEGRKNR